MDVHFKLKVLKDTSLAVKLALMPLMGEVGWGYCSSAFITRPQPLQSGEASCATWDETARGISREFIIPRVFPTIVSPGHHGLANFLAAFCIRE